MTHLSGRGMYIRFWNLLKKAVSSSQGQLVAHNRIKCWSDTPLSVPSIYKKKKNKQTISSIQSITLNCNKYYNICQCITGIIGIIISDTLMQLKKLKVSQ